MIRYDLRDFRVWEACAPLRLQLTHYHSFRISIIYAVYLSSRCFRASLSSVSFVSICLSRRLLHFYFSPIVSLHPFASVASRALCTFERTKRISILGFHGVCICVFMCLRSLSLFMYLYGRTAREQIERHQRAALSRAEPITRRTILMPGGLGEKSNLNAAIWCVAY